MFVVETFKSGEFNGVRLIKKMKRGKKVVDTKMTKAPVGSDEWYKMVAKCCAKRALRKDDGGRFLNDQSK